MTPFPRMSAAPRASARAALGPLRDDSFATIEEVGEAAALWLAEAREAGVRGLVLFVGEQAEQTEHVAEVELGEQVEQAAEVEKRFRLMLLSRAFFNSLLRNNPRLYVPQWRARLRETDSSSEAVGFITVGQTPTAAFRVPMEAKAPDVVWLIRDAISGEGAVS